MYREPCMKLVTLSVPKMSDRPAATRNSSMPLMRPPVVCVTTQDADEMHARSAWKSKICPNQTGLRSSRGALGAAASQTEDGSGYAYPIFFFHSASYSRMVFQSPGVTLGT